jgi:prepilin-type N-terminal cleavage/methylation domain-containing protein
MRRRHRSRVDRLGRDDRGFTLSEMVVVLFVTSIVMAIASTTLIFVQNTSSGIFNTANSARQATIAEEALAPLLRSAVQVCGDNTCGSFSTKCTSLVGTGAGKVSFAAPSASSFTVSVYSGVNDYQSGGSNYGNPQVSWLTVAYSQISGATTYQFSAQLVNPSCVVTQVTATNANPPNSSPPYSFQYFNPAGTQFGMAAGDNGTVPTCNLWDISRISINVAFLTGTQKVGAASNQVTTWLTSFYLQNSDTTTTSSTSSTTSCSQ